MFLFLRKTHFFFGQQVEIHFLDLKQGFNLLYSWADIGN